VTAVAVLTTVPPDFDARGLARELVEARLCACVNIVPAITSVYRWEGAVAEDGEQLLILKTVDERVSALRAALFARHPYSVPEFVVLPVRETSPAYGAWLAESSTPESPTTA
jgi:periplasmic divalent cation tolerance protein